MTADVPSSATQLNGKLLVIRLGAMGDLMHLSPSLSAVRDAAPGLEIHLLTAPLYRALAEQLPGVSQVWTLDKKHYWAELARLRAEMSGITHVVNLHPSFKTWLLTRLLAPNASRQYRKQKFKVRGLALRGVARRHAVADFYEPFRQLLDLPEKSAADLPPVLPVDAPTDASKADGPGIECKIQPRIAVIPGVGGKRANRAWPVAQYRTLNHMLQQAYPDARILLVGGPEDRALAASLTELIAGADAAIPTVSIEDHTGRHDILGTARLLKGCHLAIGGDTGPLHLASAVGVPTVGIFGPTAITRTGPLGLHREKIAHLTPPDSLECWPCEYPDCPLPGDQQMSCMREVTVETVFSACRQLLEHS